MKRQTVEGSIFVEIQSLCYEEHGKYKCSYGEHVIDLEVLEPSKRLRIEEQYINITKTKNGYGERHWFECPNCGQNTKRLYIKASNYRFACRQCHNLTYLKCNLSGNEFEYLTYRIRQLQRELNVSKENNYQLLGLTDATIEMVPVFKPRYMRQDKFDTKRMTLESMILRRVELWMRMV